MVKRDQPGGKEKTPVFTFNYLIPHMDDQPWTFTKTNQSGGILDWHTPVKPKPDNPSPYSKEDNTQLIMITVLLVVAAAVAVNL